MLSTIHYQLSADLRLVDSDRDSGLLTVVSDSGQRLVYTNLPRSRMLHKGGGGYVRVYVMYVCMM